MYKRLLLVVVTLFISLHSVESQPGDAVTFYRNDISEIEIRDSSGRLNDVKYKFLNVVFISNEEEMAYMFSFSDNTNPLLFSFERNDYQRLPDGTRMYSGSKLDPETFDSIEYGYYLVYKSENGKAVTLIMKGTIPYVRFVLVRG